MKFSFLKDEYDPEEAQEAAWRQRRHLLKCLLADNAEEVQQCLDHEEEEDQEEPMDEEEDENEAESEDDNDSQES